MKKIILLTILASTLFSYSLQEFYSDYKKGSFLQACKKGVGIFNKYKNDEEYLTVYSFACLKSDMIDRLAVPITGLRGSKEARANASYFSAILLQKKLLYHAVVDGVDISGLNFPTTDFVLSKVFDLYSQNKFTKEDDIYSLKDGQKHYKMYIVEDKRFKKLMIDEYIGQKLIKTHSYF